LLRVGDKRQGVVGLYQPGVAGEQSPGLSVRFMGIHRNANAAYLILLYWSLAVLTEDALAPVSFTHLKLPTICSGWDFGGGGSFKKKKKTKTITRHRTGI
ncbi:hypothetical protein HUS70_22560, partial [Pandoraea nosoerga]|nr:hypothetical protein [Pandoraea nosoerga]